MGGVKDKKKIMLIAVMLVGTFVAILNQTLLSAAVPKIMEDFNIETNVAQWLTTIFMLTNAIMISISAYLINRFTTRQLYIASMSIFTVGTIIAAISPNFTFLLIARVFQAAGAGILMPLTMNTLIDIFPKENRGSAMGTVGIIIAFAPAIGPTLSGVITDAFSWHALFYLIIPIAIIDIIFAYFSLINVGEKEEHKLDIPSVILSTLGFTLLLYGFSEAGSTGWANMLIIGSILIGAIILVLFVIRQLKLEKPLLNLRVFKNKVFVYSCLVSMIVFSSMIATEMLLPIYMQTGRGFSAIESGLLLLPGAIIMGVMSPITGRLFDKYGPQKLVITGLSIMALSTFALMQLGPDTSIVYICIIYAIRMFGVSMALMPITTWGLNSVANKSIPDATASNNTLRQVAGSIGTAIFVTIQSSATSAVADQGAQFALIHGINVSFIASACISVVAVLVAIFAFYKTRNTKNVTTPTTTAA